MSLIILSKIIQATCSDVKLRNKQYIQIGEIKKDVFSPEFSLASALKAYNNDRVSLNIVFANTIDKAEEFYNKGKSRQYTGTLTAYQEFRSTDIDDWLDTEVSIKVKREKIDLYELFEKKAGKAVLIEVKFF